MDTREKIKALRAEMKALIDTAEREKRDLSQREAAEIEGKAKEVTRLAKAETARDAYASIADSEGGSPDPNDPGDGSMAPLAKGSRSASRGMEASGAWAKSASNAFKDVSRRYPGVKALIGTPVDVEDPLRIRGVSEIPSEPTNVLQLMPVVGTTDPRVTFLRQVTKTVNADVVADNALKPTSIFTFEEITERARVVAHLSEPFPERYLSDYDQLARVLDSQMRTGVLDALSRQVLSGDGLGENMTGILNTTGTTAQPFVTDVVTTLRKARTRMFNLGEQVTGWLVNPTDLEALEMMRNANGDFIFYSGVADMIFGKGTAVVPSTAIPAGQAVLADWRQCVIRVVQGDHTLVARQADDLFDRNQVKLRSEGRYVNQVERPQAFCVVDLTAPAAV